jgi:hypothetical protein
MCRTLVPIRRVYGPLLLGVMYDSLYFLSAISCEKEDAEYFGPVRCFFNRIIALLYRKS